MLTAYRGFDDPVRDAQTTFRAVLCALAEPARPGPLPVCLDDIGIAPGALAVVLALADADTPLWVSPDLGPDVRDFIRFHTGASIISDPSSSALALVGSVSTLPALDQFCLGTALTPEESTTIIVVVDDFTHGAEVELDGPGYENPRRFRVAGINGARWQDFVKNHRLFPAGVDVIFVADDLVAGLPRSSRIIESTKRQVT